MPKFVILGSCKYEPYEILALPNKLNPKLYREDHEKAYREACEVFYPAIEKADIVIVYAPDGIGDHTKQDMEYAKKHGKQIVIIEKVGQ